MAGHLTRLARQSSPVASTLVVKAIATDRPSGTAVKSKTLTR